MQLRSGLLNNPGSPAAFLSFYVPLDMSEALAMILGIAHADVLKPHDAVG